jgi:hypothetical protein
LDRRKGLQIACQRRLLCLGGGTRRPAVSEFIAHTPNSIMDFVVIVLIVAAIAAVGAATTLQPKSILRCFMSLI